MYINRIIIISVFVLLFTGLHLQAENNKTIVQNVSAKQFATLINEGKGQLIDIRTPKEFNAGHIEGAQMIDFYSPDFKSQLTKLNKEQPVYIYCRSGNRTSQTVRIMQSMGFKEVVNLQYGINDWYRSGMKLVQ